MKPPMSTPMSDIAEIACALRLSSNSFGEKKSIQVSRIVGPTRPTITNSTQNATAYLPASSAITDS